MSKKLNFASFQGKQIKKIGLTSGKVNATATRYKTKDGNDRTLLITRTVLKESSARNFFRDHALVAPSDGFKKTVYKKKA